MTYLFFCSSKILFHMNVSVVRKKFAFYIIYAFFLMMMRNF